MKKFYEKGGSVIVPQAPEEPDERIDKMTGLPYDLQAGGAFVDEEDRLGFSAAGLVTFIKRLTRGVDEVVADTRPVTRFEADQGSKDTIRNFREQEPQSFIDPNSFYYSTSKVKIDNEGKFLKHLDEEENLDLGMFKNADIEEQDNIINRFYSAAPNNKSMDIKVYREPDQRYWKAKQETETKLNAEVEDEFNNIPVDDVSLVQKYTDDIPKVSDKPVEPSTLTKEEFLKDSVEKSPQFNGSFFSGIRYDNPLSTRIPRELGMHIGTKGQAENILLRGTHPTAENMIERIATQYYMGQGMSEAAAQVAVLEKGVPDSIYDDLIKELNLSVPTGVEPSLQKGFINVKNPLILDTDMINWNPSKFLGGFDPKGKIKLAEQAQSFVDALNAQVKLRPAQFTKIVDDAAKQINTILRKKDKNSGKLLNSVYDHHINQLTKTMLEDLGFDSIKYKNLGELARVSEKKAGGNSYILFRDDQFVTDFVERADAVVGDFVPKVKVKRGKVVKEYAGVSKIEVADEAEALQRAFPEEYAGKSKEDVLADKEAFKKSRQGLGFSRRRDQLSPEDVRTYQETQYNLARGIIPQIDQFKVMLDLLPVSKTTVMPERNTFNLLETSQVLKSNQLKDHGILGRTMRIEEGTIIASRIDIPVWDSYGVKAVTLHDVTKGGDPIGYALHSSQKNVTFRTQPRDASNIGRGLADKGTIARVRGGWVNRTFDETYDLIKEIVENPTKYSDWVQVKMNPDIHSWFMDASTGLPLSRADDYLKVGDLAFAKNAVMPNGVLAQDTLTKYGSVLEAAEDIFNSKGFKEEFGYEAVGWKTPPKPIGGIDTPKEFYEGANASPVSTTYNTGGKVLGSLGRVKRNIGGKILGSLHRSMYK